MTGQSALWDVVEAKGGVLGRVMYRRGSFAEASGYLIGLSEYGREVVMRLSEDQTPWPEGVEPGEWPSRDH